jgi:hypothetical protein
LGKRCFSLPAADGPSDYCWAEKLCGAKTLRDGRTTGIATAIGAHDAIAQPRML